MPLPLTYPLPVDAALDELLAALDEDGAAVLQAPPGSGKTTRVPLALLDTPWLAARRVLVLEPRRVAARAAARRMAETLGEDVGQRVGYRVRHEQVTSPATKIEVITEGVLVRMLQADPSLEGVGAVLFDEFHERSITADLALALSLDARSVLRPELRVLVMSATLEATAVSALIGDAPVITASAIAYPVTTVWAGRPSGRVDAAVARTVVRALAECEGDILAFLPGVAEIRRVERALGDADVATAADIVTLYGAMSGPAQDEALRPAAADRRKVVLATSIAETSLTIDGVRVVVDSGLMRVPRFDPSAGMTRLVTLPVSKTSATQRQGRAARQAPGVCYRLWSETEHAGLARTAPPEILVADLAPLALDLAEWGVDDPSGLRWLDPPPAGPFDAARQVLGDLGAIDDDRRITAHGRAIAGLGVHPRLGHLLVWAAEAEASAPGTVGLACEIAAVLSEGDPERSRTVVDADLAARVEGVRRGRYPRLTDVARQWHRQLDHSPDPRGPARRTGRAGSRRATVDNPAAVTGPRSHGATVDSPTAGAGAGSRNTTVGVVVPEDVGRLASLAYPDRVGKLRVDRPGHWLLRNGRGAWVPESDPMATSPWIVAAELDGDRRDARIWLGAPLDPRDVEALFGEAMTTVDRSGWDPRASDVVATRERRLGAIVVSATPQPGGGPDGLIEGVRALGLDLLPWTPELQRLRSRVAFARRVEGDSWADLSDTALADDLDTWLTPWLQGRNRRRDLAGVALGDALWQRIGWARRADLDAVAPTHLTMPTGERRRLEYPPEGPPTVAVRLQELFGTAVTPTVANGRVPVRLHLTSPAGRPVQVTSDLASFWATTYPQVRGELRARYPRHSWPDDPLHATPTSRATPRRP